MELSAFVPVVEVGTPCTSIRYHFIINTVGDMCCNH